MTVTSRDLSALAREGASGRAVVALPRYPWKTRIGVPALVVLVLLALVAYAGRDALVPAVDVRVVPVVMKMGSEAGSPSQPGAAVPQATQAGAVVQAAGWVEADPYPVAVSALAEGIVKEVLVLEGERVKQGQVVARLVPDDAKLLVARAEADVGEKQAQLTAAQRAWDNPVERVRAVANAQAMVAETQAELVRLEAEVNAESAKADELADQVKRLEESFKGNAVSESEVVGTRLKLKAQRATLEAMKARKPVLEAQLQQRTAELAAARDNQKLRIEEEKTLAAAKATLALAVAMRDEARLRLARMEVTSPVEGVVMQRHVEPGAKLMLAMDDRNSMAIVHLYDPTKLQVRVDVPLADAAKVGVGMAAKVVVGVLPDQSFDGVVTRIQQEADVAKNTLQVKVAIKNPAPELKPEMLARVRFTGELQRAATGPATAAGNVMKGHLIFAPETLIQRRGEHAVTWIVERGANVARQRTVTLGSTRQQGWVSVTSGLSAGDQLIADASRMSEGKKVRVVGEADVAQKLDGADRAKNGGGHGVH